jgi:hypothetical protein
MHPGCGGGVKTRETEKVGFSGESLDPFVWCRRGKAKTSCVFRVIVTGDFAKA